MQSATGILYPFRLRLFVYNKLFRQNNGRNFVGNATYPSFFFFNDGVRFFVRQRLSSSPLSNNGQLNQFGWSMLFINGSDYSHYVYALQVDASGADQILFQENTAWTTIGDPSDTAEVTLNSTAVCYAADASACAININVTTACLGTGWLSYFWGVFLTQHAAFPRHPQAALATRIFFLISGFPQTG